MCILTHIECDEPLHSTQASAKDERYSKEMAAMWICIPVLVVLVIAALYIASTW
jgi:heme/copper-type cytochrome/quinol oxidase subunit 2